MRRKSRRVDITVDEGVWQEKLVGVDGRWLLDIVIVVDGDDTVAGDSVADYSRTVVAGSSLDIVVAGGAGVVVDNVVVVVAVADGIVIVVVVVVAVVLVVDSIAVVAVVVVDGCPSFPRNLHTYVHTSTPTEQTHYIPIQHSPP